MLSSARTFPCEDLSRLKVPSRFRANEALRLNSWFVRSLRQSSESSAGRLRPVRCYFFSFSMTCWRNPCRQAARHRSIVKFEYVGPKRAKSSLHFAISAHGRSTLGVGCILERVGQRVLGRAVAACDAPRDRGPGEIEGGCRWFRIGICDVDNVSEELILL